MKHLLVIILCAIGFTSQAQNTLSFSGEQELDKTPYQEVSYFHKGATNKYSISYLARKGNDVVYVIESTKHISYCYVLYGFRNNYEDKDNAFYQSSEINAYTESYDATTGKYTMIVNLGDYRELDPVQEHYITIATALIQYEEQPKEYNLTFVAEK